MKRKRTSSAVFNSSSKQRTVASYYLPDECWESIFRFIIISDDNNNNDDDYCTKNNNYDCNINNHYLNSLSVVSKQFLSITNRLPFSLTLYLPSPNSSHLIKRFPQSSLSPTVSYSRSFTVNNELKYCHIFKRFTNLTSLNLDGCRFKANKLLGKISDFPMKQLTSLNISFLPAFPITGLQAFSQKITTLTSITCSNMRSLNTSHLFLIAECFPLLQKLDLSHSGHKNSSSYVDGVEALSLALIKLLKVNLSGFPVNNQSLFHLFNNCKQLEEVIIFECDEITSTGLTSALRERPTLRSLSFSNTKGIEGFTTSQFIESLVSLKGLTCLELHYLNISDALLYSIAREGLPLTRLDLHSCNGYSYAGIFGLLSKCQHIQHLNLQGNHYLNDQHVVQLSSFLGDLVSINLSGCRKITYSALFALVRKCPSLSEIKIKNILGNIVGNSDSLLEFGVYPQLKALYLGGYSWLSDEILIMVTSIFPNLQLLDLTDCNHISEGICQVLRKCCKIKHLNLAYCSRVKLLGINFVVPNLESLNLSYTNVDDETIYVISKNCPGLLQLLLERCIGVTKKGVKHVLENCTQLRAPLYKYIYC